MPASSRTPAAPLARGADRATEEPLALFTTLARTGLHLDALQRECLSEFGLSFTEYSVLRLLQRAPGRRLAPGMLAEEVLCTSGAMTKVVDRLERAGNVERERDPSDRRGVLVHLLAAGHRIANDAAASYGDGRLRILDGLNVSEVARIHAGLRRLLDALETDRSRP